MLPTLTNVNRNLCRHSAASTPKVATQESSWCKLSKTSEHKRPFSFLIPPDCKISASRLDKCIPQLIHGRPQLISKDGSFAFTDLSKISPGGILETDHFNEDTVNCIILGDMGSAGNQQESVVSQVTKRVQEAPLDMRTLIVGVGDWVYPRGPNSLSEPEQTRTINTVLRTYGPLTEVGEVIGLLGNHEWGDHHAGAEPDAFMALARQFGINIPSRYFCKSLIGNDFDVHIVAVDSTVLAGDPKQQIWIKETIEQLRLTEEKSHKRQWIILAAHHPYESYGHHAGQTRYLNDILGDTLEKVDLCVSGHEHDLEYIKPKDGRPPLIVSGTASTSRKPGNHLSDLLNSNAPGYATVRIDKNAINVDFMSVTGSADDAVDHNLLSDKITHN